MKIAINDLKIEKCAGWTQRTPSGYSAEDSNWECDNKSSNITTWVTFKLWLGKQKLTKLWTFCLDWTALLRLLQLLLGKFTSWWQHCVDKFPKSCWVRTEVLPEVISAAPWCSLLKFYLFHLARHCLLRSRRNHGSTYLTLYGWNLLLLLALPLEDIPGPVLETADKLVPYGINKFWKHCAFITT